MTDQHKRILTIQANWDNGCTAEPYTIIDAICDYDNCLDAKIDDQGNVHVGDNDGHWLDDNQIGKLADWLAE